MPILPPPGVEITHERLHREPAKAYERFRIYCDMGPERSYTRLAGECHISRTRVAQMANRYQWQERLRSYERWQAEMRRDADATAALESARRRHLRQEELREKCWELQAKCAEKFAQMMLFPVSKQEIKTSADGKRVTIIMPGPWRFGDSIRMAQAVRDLGAFACGMTNKMIDPQTGRQIGEDDETAGDMPVELPKMVIEIRDTTGKTPVESIEVNSATSPSTIKGHDQSGFHFSRT